MANISNDWSYTTLGMNLSPGGVTPPPHNNPSHAKPEVEDTGIPDEENDSLSFIVGGSSPTSYNYFHRLHSATDDSYNPPFAVPPAGIVRDDPPVAAYGNSLGVHGIVLEQVQEPDRVRGVNIDRVQGGVNLDEVQGINIDQVREGPPVSDPLLLQSPTSDQLPVVQSVRSMDPVTDTIDSTDITPSTDSNNQRDNTSSPVAINRVNTSSGTGTNNTSISSKSKRNNYFVKPKSSSVANCGSVPPSQATSSITSFPTEPTILADKYAVLGPVDASTCHGICLRNHDTVHVKAVSPRTARDVCAQQAMLVRDVGVRAPLEAVISGCGKRAWLVFPPHFGDLHSYVRLRRRLREAEAQRLFAQVATTVENCHSSGLVLRDLKLRKFVFTDSNRQHVVLESVEDSVVAGESDLLHDKHGCPAYVAPEILSSSAYSGRHADMWGLGVILYTMLVGRYPFHNGDTAALFAKIRSGKFFIPDWVSSRARHLILSLLRRQPQRRLTAEQVMMHPWLNRVPRDHVGKDAHDHIVPGQVCVPSTVGKSRPP